MIDSWGTVHCIHLSIQLIQKPTTIILSDYWFVIIIMRYVRFVDQERGRAVNRLIANHVT